MHRQGTAAAAGQSGVTAGRRDFIAPLLGWFNRAISMTVTGIIDDFDMQSKMDKRVSHQKRSIGDTVQCFLGLVVSRHAYYATDATGSEPW